VTTYYVTKWVIRHSSADACRHNGEVVTALHDYLTKHPEALKNR